MRAKVRRNRIGCRLVLPRPAKTPEFVQFPPPDVGDDVHVRRGVLAEDIGTDLVGSAANSFLEPFRNPCIYMRSGLRCPDANLAGGLHSIDVKIRHIGYAARCTEIEIKSARS